MKKIASVFIMLVMFCACKKAQIEHTEHVNIAVPWNDTSAQHPRNTQLKALIEKYRIKGLPGISLLVSDKDGTWVGATGMADIAKGVPFTAATVSKAASITKLFVGTLMFKLMEDSVNSGLGYSALQQPVSKWLPAAVIDKIPNGKLVTLGQCMKHETGIPDLIDQSKFYLAVLNNPNRVWTQTDLLEFIYGLDPIFSPGDTAIYSNTNTVLVSMVIEAAAKRSHDQLLHEKIINPLGLSHTFYQPHDQLPANTAQGYFDLYNNGSIVNVSNLVTGSGNGYGGLYSNLFDLYTFADRLLVKQNLLSAKSLSLMQTFGKADGVNRYGYGIMRKFIDREPNAGIGHSGRDVGYSANLFYFPSKKVLHIFFVNYGTDGDSKLRQTFYDFQEELLDITLQ